MNLTVPLGVTIRVLQMSAMRGIYLPEIMPSAFTSSTPNFSITSTKVSFIFATLNPFTIGHRNNQTCTRCGDFFSGCESGTIRNGSKCELA